MNEEKIYQPKTARELLNLLKDYKTCKVAWSHAFKGAKALEDNNCGFSFSFKKSKNDNNWAIFKRE